jgi:L-glyceraldehyde 3-phosphate reductase
VENAHDKIVELNNIAQERGQSLAQMALAWVLKDKRITSVLIGASSVKQINNNVETLKKIDFSKEELKSIESILG